MTNFALKIKGGGRGVAHAKSSDPATPKKKIWNVHMSCDQCYTISSAILGW